MKYPRGKKKTLVGWGMQKYLTSYVQIIARLINNWNVKYENLLVIFSLLWTKEDQETSITKLRNLFL